VGDVLGSIGGTPDFGPGVEGKAEARKRSMRGRR